MPNLYIRQAGQDPFPMEKNEVVPAIKSGMLSAGDEISADGKNWMPLGAHKQLGALFKTASAAPAAAPKTATGQTAPAASKPRKMSMREFYSSDRVFCPKCGFEQDRTASCQKCDIIFDKYWEIKTEGPRSKAEPRETMPVVESSGSGNMLARLWRGEYPLWITFWIFGAGIPFVIWFLFQTLVLTSGMQEMMTQNPSPDEMMEMMRGKFRSMMIMSAIMFPYQFIVAVGLWRAARVYEGFALWRVLVQICVVLFFISIPFTLFSYISGWNAMEQQLQQMQMMMEMQQNQMQQNPGFQR